MLYVSDFMPVINNEGKVVFSSEFKLLTVENGCCQTLHHVLNQAIGSKKGLLEQYHQ